MSHIFKSRQLLLGFVILVALIFFFFRRRRTKVRGPYGSGMEQRERNHLGLQASSSGTNVRVLRPESSSPIPPRTERSDAYIPTPFPMQGSTSAPSSSGSIFYPLTERPTSTAVPSPVIIRRTDKIAEINQARRLAVVGSGVSMGSSSPNASASALDPHEIPLPFSPAQQTSPADSSTVPVIVSPINPTARNQQINPHDSHPVGLPDEPPPQYDAIA